MIFLHKVFRLSNGIRVVAEYMDYAKSVSAGIWVYAGSSMETARNNGVSHFIEHLLFKGTKKRTAKEIARCMDMVGGRLNAVTAKEYTCYYTKTLPEHLEMSLELLSDMLNNSNFAQGDIDVERKVILEEISMCEDDPEELIYDIVCGAMWQGEPLGMNVTGSAQSVEGITGDEILEYFNKRYVAENMVISLAGNFDCDRVPEILEKGFGGIKSGGDEKREQKKIIHSNKVEIVKKDTEQCQLCLAFEGFPRGSKQGFDLAVLNALFGGNMSSRLFQKVREEQGLAYSVYSDIAAHLNNGYIAIWAGLSPENLGQALGIINREIKILKEKGVTAEEVEIAKTQLKASIVMDDEGISSRECSNGKELLLDGRLRPLEEIIGHIDEVTSEGVEKMIDFVFDRNRMTVAVLGKVDIDEKEVLNILNF